MGTAAAGVATLAPSTAPSAREAGAPASNITPPEGPWREFGSLRRAGGTLHYAELGPKTSKEPPIILLHKLGGWLSDWRFVAPGLAQKRRVIAFDLPGHGGSKWDGDPPYILTLGEIAAIMVGAFQEMEIERADIIGTSLGGCAAVPLTAFWPERVRKLALVSSALPRARTLAQIKANDPFEARVNYDANGMPLPIPMGNLRELFGIVNFEQIHREGEASRQAAGRWILPSQRGVAITDLVGLLARIQVPTLLLYGDRDKNYQRHVAGAQTALKNSVTKYVTNSGAFVMQDNPPETAEILKDWVDA